MLQPSAQKKLQVKKEESYNENRNYRIHCG